jgi:hypothetical protein
MVVQFQLDALRHTLVDHVLSDEGVPLTAIGSNSRLAPRRSDEMMDIVAADHVIGTGAADCLPSYKVGQIGKFC